jgi:hypothetical protein
LCAGWKLRQYNASNNASVYDWSLFTNGQCTVPVHVHDGHVQYGLHRHSCHCAVQYDCKSTSDIFLLAHYGGGKCTKLARLDRCTLHNVIACHAYTYIFTYVVTLSPLFTAMTTMHFYRVFNDMQKFLMTRFIPSSCIPLVVRP